MLEAIASIPAYVEASETFLVLCPPVSHYRDGHAC